MKNSLSLPYLNHIKVKDEAPIAVYLQQKTKDRDGTLCLDENDLKKGGKAERKKKKMLIIAEKNFLKLN